MAVALCYSPPLNPAVRLRIVLFLPALALLCANVLILAFAGSYNIDLPPLTLAARGMFKPLLWTNAVFLLVLLIGPVLPDSYSVNTRPVRGNVFGVRRFAFCALCGTALIYFPSLFVNFQSLYWDHSNVSQTVRTFSDLAGLFAHRQPDGFFRPLGFLSLWLDDVTFGKAAWGDHLQSIVLHVINALILRKLLLLLSVDVSAAGWTALIWLFAAVNFEPVLWPAARFDVLATMFILAGLCAAVSYLRSAGLANWRLLLTCLCFVLAVFVKETAYSLPVLVLFLGLTARLWGLEHAGRRKLALLCGSLALLVMLTMWGRVALYGDIGGYRDLAGNPMYNAWGAKSAFYLVSRTLLLPLLGVNMSVPPNLLLSIIACGFSLFVLASTWTFQGWRDHRHFAFIACALISALPALIVLGWIGPSMLHSRHLYLPGMWMFAFLVDALSSSRWRVGLLTLFCGLNGMGAVYNVSVQRQALDRVNAFASVVQKDTRGAPAGTRVALVGVPLTPNGVLFFQEELVQRVKSVAQRSDVVVTNAGTAPAAAGTRTLVYCWDEKTGTLARCSSAR